MVDIFSREKRSYVMRQVRGKSTAPEKVVRSILRQMGFKYRANQQNLPGTPDIVLPARRKVIFVHGCFWHSHKNCIRARRPKTNRKYWTTKLDRNVARDSSNRRKLYRLGWRSLIVWECKTDDVEKLKRRISKFLSSGP